MLSAASGGRLVGRTKNQSKNAVFENENVGLDGKEHQQLLRVIMSMDQYTYPSRSREERSVAGNCKGQ